MRQKWIPVLLALIVLFSFTLTTRAATISDTGWSYKTSGSGDASLANGKITLSATGYKQIFNRTRDASITLTNDTGTTQILSGPISFSGSFGSYTITLPDGSIVSGSSAGSYGENITMENGQSLTIYVKSPSGSGTINCSYEPTVIPSSSKTITCNTASGGTYTVNGNTVTSVDFNTGDTLTLAVTPDTDNGYVCLGFWIDGTTLLPMDASKTKAWVPTDGGTITPIFAQLSDTSAPFSVSGKNYYTWETAMTAADGGNTVVLTGDYTLPTTLEGNGLTKDGTYVKYDTATKNISYSVDAGVTLLLPYSSSDYSIKSGTGSTNDFKHANVAFIDDDDSANSATSESAMSPSHGLYLTLTIPEGTTVDVADGTSSSFGRIVVGGSIAGNEGSAGTVYEGLCYGAHSNLEVNGTLNLGSYSILSAVGYVIGNENGKICTTGENAEIYQPLVLHDWRGGRASVPYVDLSDQSNWLATYDTIIGTIQSGESEICPFTQWGIFNIQPTMTITHGNTMYLYASLADGSYYCSHPVFVGSGEGVFQLGEGASLTSVYRDITWSSGYTYGFPGKMELTISGGASVGSMVLKGTVANVADITINTANYTLPISYCYSITMTKGNYYIDTSMSILPGATVTVDAGATLYIGTKTTTAMRFMVFDGLHNLSNHSTSAEVTITYSATRPSGNYYRKNYPTTAEIQAATINGAAMSGDAELIVNGTLVIGANANLGGTIQTDGEGVINATAGTAGSTISTAVQIGLVGSKKYQASLLSGTSYFAGMYLKESTAKIVSKATGKTVDIVRGNTYYGAEYSSTQDTYSFKLYTTSSDITQVILVGDVQASSGETATTRNAHALNETIRGAWCAHSWQDATCTEPKTCTICGATEGEANGHSFTNGVCSVCGCYLFEFTAANVVLGNNLDMAFRFVYNGTETDLSGYTVKLTHTDAENKTVAEVTYSFSNWNTDLDDNGTSFYYVVYDGLAARRMCDTITLAVYDSNGARVSNTWIDSMQAYAMRMLEDTTDADTYKRTVLVDMLNYGAEAQVHFEYNYESANLANALLSTEQQAYATASLKNTSVPESNLTFEGSNWLKSNLVTTSNIQFLMAIEGLSQDSSVTVTYTNHRDDLKRPSPTIGQAGDYYYVAIEELVVADAWCLVTVTVDGVEYTDSIAGYLARYTGESLVFDAYLKFADSAYAYFHPTASTS